MDENKTWDWEELENLLGRLRPYKCEPCVKKHISTLIMEGHFEQVSIGKPSNYPDLLRKTRTRAIYDKDTKEEILFSQAIRFFQESEADLTITFNIMQTENPKQTITELSPNKMVYMQKKFRKLSKEHIYPYRFRDDAVPYEFFSQLFKFRHYEATVRLFIDALLKPIKQQNDLKVLVEEPLEKVTNDEDDSEQKMNKPDYLIFYKDMPLGMIEAKNGRYIIRRSITQCMKQLLALHKKKQELSRRNGPLFGVVTDALHYIFIILTQDKRFVFEREYYGQTPQEVEPIIGEIKVHTANTWEDLDDITVTINGLCQQMIKENSFTCFDVSPGTEVAADVGILQKYKERYDKYVSSEKNQYLDNQEGKIQKRFYDQKQISELGKSVVRPAYKQSRGNANMGTEEGHHQELTARHKKGELCGTRREDDANNGSRDRSNHHYGNEPFAQRPTSVNRIRRVFSPSDYIPPAAGIPDEYFPEKKSDGMYHCVLPNCKEEKQYLPTMYSHIRYEHAGPINCAECGNVYYSVSGINKHMEKKHPSAGGSSKHKGKKTPIRK